MRIVGNVGNNRRDGEVFFVILPNGLPEHIDAAEILQRDFFSDNNTFGVFKGMFAIALNDREGEDVKEIRVCKNDTLLLELDLAHLHKIAFLLGNAHCLLYFRDFCFHRKR